MPLIISRGPGADVSLVAFDTNGDAKVGRWCRPPQYPDRCARCFDPDTLLTLPATHFYEGEDGYRHGACAGCLDRHPEARPIPVADPVMGGGCH